MNLALNPRRPVHPTRMCAFGIPDGFTGRALSEHSELRILHPECSFGTKRSLQSFTSRSFQCAPLCILCTTNPLSFHTNAKRPSRNPFLLLFLQMPGCVPPQAKCLSGLSTYKTNALPSISFVLFLLQTLFTLLPPTKRRNPSRIRRFRALWKTTEGVPSLGGMANRCRGCAC